MAVLAVFYQIGSTAVHDFMLDLGTIGLPRPRFLAFMALWGSFGLAAIALLGLAFARLVSPGQLVERWAGRWSRGSDAAWMAVAACSGFLLTWIIRAFILEGAPLTDDESAYRFMGELLASGRLRAPSPPMKLFFDRAFMINDGHLYAIYTVGWPALMAPGVLLGKPGLVNPALFGLTVVPLFLILRRLAGSAWARLGVLLLLLSPMLLVCAATEMAHTSCFFALAWMFWFGLRSRDEGAPTWSHAGVAFCFAAAFFIRPQSALGPGLPLLVWWLVGLRRFEGRRRLLAAVAFAVPAALLAAAFLAVNYVQNGSPWLLSYQRVLSYVVENKFRFSGATPDTITPIINYDFSNLSAAFANSGLGLFRLNVDLFGWPFSLGVAAFAGLRRQAGLFWAAAAGFIAMMLFGTNAGVDPFGPAHYVELGLPILILTVLAVRAVTDRLARLDALETAPDAAPSRRTRLAALPSSMVLAAVVIALCGFTPIRLAAVARIAQNINLPARELARRQLRSAVVFVKHPYAPPCRSFPSRHFVFWWPNNDPDLRNDVLWANHISVKEDRALLQRLGRREGHVMVWRGLPCRVEFVPLSQFVEPARRPEGQHPRRAAKP